MRLRRGQLLLLGRESRHGRQERPIEHPHMDLADFALDALPHCPDADAVGGESGRTRQDALLVGCPRHEVGAAQIAQLHTVLQHAQHAVIAGERRGIRPSDVALRHERLEGIERAALADAVIGEPVHELEELHGELDVADAAGTELELIRDVLCGNELGDALTHALHAVDEVLAGRARPYLRLDGVDVCLAEHAVAGERARLEKRLELPALRPAVVVREVRLEAADQRPLFALGTQIRVDLPQWRLDLHPGDAAHRLDRESSRDIDDTALPDLFDELVGPTADEDHVDVAHVVEFARAGLAHADDRKPRRRDLVARKESRAPASRHPRARDAEGGFEGRAGRVRERRRHLGENRDGIGRREVVGGDAREEATIADAQRDPGLLVARLGESLRVRADRTPQLGDEIVRGRQAIPGRDEVREFAGMPQVEVAEPVRRAEETPHHGTDTRQRRRDGTAVAPGDARERTQRGIRVGSRFGAAQDVGALHAEDVGEFGEEFESVADLAEAIACQHGPDGRALACRHGCQSISRLLFSSNGVTCARYSCHSRRLLSST